MWRVRPKREDAHRKRRLGLVDAARDQGLDVEGLMTVPPAAGDPTPIFEKLRRSCDELGLSTCSMGMSGDFEMAIAAGATMVRVGTAVFGPRRRSATITYAEQAPTRTA